MNYGQPPQSQPQQPPPLHQPVVVTDVRMPFISMVIFMIKWALASIPAMIIMSIFGAVLGVLLFFVLAALGIAAGAAASH